MNRKLLAELITNLKSLLIPKNQKLIPVRVHVSNNNHRNLTGLK